MDDPLELQPLYTPPPPISRVPSYIQFAPRRAIASFENLVALANYEERLREARKIVWRDRGERPVELDNLWECFEHAGRGGLRAASLAFAIRSGVNFILLMTRIKKVPRSYRFALIRQALFGSESARFAAMLGLFVSIYKFMLNSLPLLMPEPEPLRPKTQSKKESFARSRAKFRAEHPLRSDLLPSASTNALLNDDAEEEDIEAMLGSSRRARLSMSAQAHQMWVRKKTRRWYSVLSGAVAGGLAIMCEKRSRRTTIAQQLFVRGLQGTYNAYSEKHGFTIPHGDVILFSLCCGQILYGFLLRPDTLPRSYVNWIQQTGKIPPESVTINRDLVRDHIFKIPDMEAILNRTDLTPENRVDAMARLAQATSPNPSFGPYFSPCCTVHPWENYCRNVPFERFFSVLKLMIPIYGALHLIPLLLFKRKTALKEPLKVLLRAAFGTARSSAFLGVFVVIYQSFFCFKHQTWLYLMALRSEKSRAALARLAKLLPQPIIDFLLSKPSFWIGGLLTGLSLFVEEKKRRPELAMYTLPKGLESAWIMARGEGLVFKTGQWGEAALTAVGMGMVMSIYQNDPEHLSGLVRRILYQFVGPN